MIQPLSPILTKAWQHRAGPVVLATVNPRHDRNEPNVIYISQVQCYGEAAFMIADVHFHKTRQNIADGSRGAMLFITDEGKSFQFKGRLTVHRDGAEMDHLRTWLDSEHVPHAAVVLHVEQAFQGATQLQ